MDVKTKTLSILVLLLMAVTGAWAQTESNEVATTRDGDNLTLTVGKDTTEQQGNVLFFPASGCRFWGYFTCTMR